MYKKQIIAAVIFARGGSSLYKKNMRLLKGIPLIGYSIGPALKSQYIDKVIVATDDQEIEATSLEMGAEVFNLPSEITTDASGTDAALLYMTDWFEQNGIDVIVYMQPTDLFKESEWMDECISRLIDGNFSSVFVGCATHKNYWYISDDKCQRAIHIKNPYINRQQKSPIYREDTGLGAAIRVSSIIKNQNRLGDNPHLIEKEYLFFDLHNELDFYLAEAFLEFQKWQRLQYQL